jgi:hypothetical protein
MGSLVGCPPITMTLPNSKVTWWLSINTTSKQAHNVDDDTFALQHLLVKIIARCNPITKCVLSPLLEYQSPQAHSPWWLKAPWPLMVTSKCKPIFKCCVEIL